MYQASDAAVTCRGPVWRCADQAQINQASCELVGFSCISWPGSDRSFALTVRRPPHAPDVPSAAQSDRGSAHCNCRNPVIFAPRQHGPDRARHFVGECDGQQHPWLARQQAMQPASLWPALSGGQADDSHRADNQQAPDVALAHLRGLAEKRLAARRMLPGNKPEPSGKVAAASEDRHRRAKVSIAIAVIGPTPGMVCRRRIVAPRAAS